MCVHSGSAGSRKVSFLWESKIISDITPVKYKICWKIPKEREHLKELRVAGWKVLICTPLIAWNMLIASTVKTGVTYSSEITCDFKSISLLCIPVNTAVQDQICEVTTLIFCTNPSSTEV
jgi:hypothetical protein